MFGKHRGDQGTRAVLSGPGHPEQPNKVCAAPGLGVGAGVASSVLLEIDAYPTTATPINTCEGLLYMEGAGAEAPETQRQDALGTWG